jgi:hypothetical protein
MIDQVKKDSNYRDPKMEAYCNEVWRLEDKFHSLELNHVTRRYNEAADELTKIASNRATVPPDVSSRDLHQPSINTRTIEGPIVHCSAPHLRWKPPRPGLTSCRWKARPYQPTSSPTDVFHTSTVSLKESSPSIRPRLDGSLAGPKPL